MFDQDLSGVRNVLSRDSDIVDLDPAWMRHPLRRKSLKLFDCMVRRIVQERTDQIKAFVVGDVRSGLLMARLAVCVLYRSVSAVDTTSWE